uniref:Uncharacterized protein n=1 Tax=Dinoroseobacter phage vB_DshS_R26L TaxID=3161158 RepID=A0AAU7VGK2_9CAUD
MADETHDTEHARRVKEAVSRLNDVAADAIRAGLSIEYDVHRIEQLGMPTGECIQVHVRREL